MPRASTTAALAIGFLVVEEGCVPWTASARL
jgi:hypothetical protein